MEAYPDVANNYVQIITQWPGRAAEEVEQQVTIPIEIQMNGLPKLVALRSVSLFGLSSLMMIFDDDSVNDLNRQKVLEKLAQVNLPAGLQPVLGPDFSPVGQIYFYTLKSTNPAYGVMELKWYLDHHPDRDQALAAMHTFADVGEQVILSAFTEAALVEPVAILLGGGLAKIDLGMEGMTKLWQMFIDEYLQRCERAGFPRRERCTIPLEIPWRTDQ